MPIVTAQQILLETLNLTTILHQFPTRNDAILLLKHFIETFDAMYRNLHVPTTWRLLKEMYDDLDFQRIPSATQLAFFLGIFAGSAYVSNSNLKLECPASARTSPLALAELWHKQAVLVLTKSPVPPSTQALIALMTLAHLCTQIEGFSGSFGILAMSGLQMARTMRIHRLDSYRFREERRKNGADMVDVELKRRVWWHMVASDWFDTGFRNRINTSSVLIITGFVQMWAAHMKAHTCFIQAKSRHSTRATPRITTSPQESRTSQKKLIASLSAHQQPSPTFSGDSKSPPFLEK